MLYGNVEIHSEHHDDDEPNVDGLRCGQPSHKQDRLFAYKQVSPHAGSSCRLRMAFPSRKSAFSAVKFSSPPILPKPWKLQYKTSFK